MVLVFYRNIGLESDPDLRCPNESGLDPDWIISTLRVRQKLTNAREFA